MNTVFKSAVFLIASGLLATFSAQAFANEVNVYSARKEALIKPLLNDFTQQTDIKVNLVTGKADALLKRLETEGANTPADLLITTDAGRLYRAQIAGVLQPVKSEALTKVIPVAYRELQGYWFGLSLRARPIFYVKGKIKPEQLSDYEVLANPIFKNKVCIRSSGNIYNQSLVASMIEVNGKEATEKWAKGLVANLARSPKGGDRDQIRAAAAGQCDIAIANTYYYAAMLSGKKQADRDAANKLEIFWPNQANRGTHVNISGAAVTKHAKNKANAIKLIEFMASKKAQEWYANANHEYPVRSDVEVSEILKSWGKFKSDSINLSVLGLNNPKAVRLMDRAGWK